MFLYSIAPRWTEQVYENCSLFGDGNEEESERGNKEAGRKTSFHQVVVKLLQTSDFQKSQVLKVLVSEGFFFVCVFVCLCVVVVFVCVCVWGVACWIEKEGHSKWPMWRVQLPEPRKMCVQGDVDIVRSRSQCLTHILSEWKPVKDLRTGIVSRLSSSVLENPTFLGLL